MLKADQIFVKVRKDDETCEVQYNQAGLPVAFDGNSEVLQLALRGLEGSVRFDSQLTGASGAAAPALILQGPGQGISVAEPLDSQGLIAVHWRRRLGGGAQERAVQLIQAFAVLTNAFLAGMDEDAVREARLCRRETALDQVDQQASRRLRASEERTAEAEELAVRDELTGLHNRRGFLLKAEERFSLARRQDLACAVIFADVDGLKAVNDEYGHEVGDDLIREAASIFRQSFRAADVVARLGGDEFVAFTIDDSKPETILQRLQSLIQMFNGAGEHPYRLSLSTGVAVCTPSTTATLADYLQLADAEMYKRKRRNIAD
jgi:diguanylate cyclase (GGDEF)-like protein